MWITEKVSRKIVFSGADVWQIAKSVLAEDFPDFTIHVGRREASGRFAGGGLGAGLMLVVADEDGYELDYGQRVIIEACSQAARDLGYSIDSGAIAKLCRDEQEQILPIPALGYEPKHLTEGTRGYLRWSQYEQGGVTPVRFAVDFQATERARARIKAKLKVLRNEISSTASFVRVDATDPF